MRKIEIIKALENVAYDAAIAIVSILAKANEDYTVLGGDPNDVDLQCKILELINDAGTD